VPYIPPFNLVRNIAGITAAEGKPRVTLSYGDFIKIIRRLLAGVTVDEAWYLQRYVDVANAVAAGKVGSARQHFINHGYFEGRLPGPVQAEDAAAALELGARGREVRLQYAAILREQRRVEEAEEVYRALLADEPQAWQALAGLGICARMRRDLVAAAEHLAAALALAPRERGVRLEYAGTLREQRRVEEAEEVYRALLADEPQAWQALVGLGICARMRRDQSAALEHFIAATEAAPDIESPGVELAHEHREAGRFDQARAVLRSLIDRGLAGAPTWFGLGIVERWSGDRAAALDAFREGHSRYPEWHQFLIEIAIEERAFGRFAEAEQWLLRASEIPTVAGAALLQLGEMARMRQDLEQALDLFRRAAQLPTAPIGVHSLMAQTLADLGCLNEAFDVLDAAEQQFGRWPEFAHKRAFLLRRAGFRQEALAEAREAVAAFPMNLPLWFEWFENERISGDFANIDRCLDAAPAGHLHEHAQVHLARGLAAEQRWDLKTAAAEFRKALALNPMMIGLHEVLARIALLQFDIPTAREHLQAMKRLREPTQRELGMSPHLTHTHIGNFFDEFVIDRAALDALVAAQTLPPAERIEPLLALVRTAPDHTPTAIALLVALRQAGQFVLCRHEAEAHAIPATIMQYWDEATPPDDLAALMESWRTCNPGHRYVRFDHAAAQDFLKARCTPEVLRAYLRAREPAMKADLFRLAYLFAEGGYYGDADDRCLRPLREALPPQASFVAYQENFGTLGNNFLAAAPRHPVIGLALQLAVEAVNRGDDDMLWLSTGPGLMTRAFAQILATSVLRPDAWLERTCILANHELERIVAAHCDVRYKKSRRHWLRAVFGQPKPTHVGPMKR
jgi:tetratricopeptide (TPR) repeat protein